MITCHIWWVLVLLMYITYSIYTEISIGKEFWKEYIRNWHCTLPLRNGMWVLEWVKDLLYCIHVFKVLDFVLPYVCTAYCSTCKCGPWASGISITWSLFVVQILRLLESDALEMPSNLCFSKPSEWFWCMLKLEKWKDIDYFIYYMTKAGLKSPPVLKTSS